MIQRALMEITDTELMRRDSIQRGRRLEYLTIGWNMVEAAVAIGAGVFARSTALLGFGIDSLIESLSGSVLLWRLRHGQKGEQREQKARKLVGISLLVLAAYIAFEAVEALIEQEPPAASYGGIVIAFLAVIVMPMLARAKRKVAASLESRAMHADSRQSDICGYLSAILLIGLGANALLGWWWADPVAGLVMVPIIVTEGIEALRGETCGCDRACRPSERIGT
ncbi:MAG: cation diffusion facilitator family transporter [Thermoguttaceae bacterium]